MVRFDNMIIDEAGIERLEHLLSPFVLGINQIGVQMMESISYGINSIIELASTCGVVATVVGDPKQSRPIKSEDYDLSAIEWVLKCAKCDTLYTTYRLPDDLAMLVNEFADYQGLTSAPEIAGRRLVVACNTIDKEFRNIINPDKVVTWLDLNGTEEMAGPSSWYNDLEARACVRICHEIKKAAPSKSIMIVTRYAEQRRIVSKYLQQFGLGVRVLTTVGALGTQSDIVIFTIVRNNPERRIGAIGSLQDLNVAISRSKEKLIIVGSFDMMINAKPRIHSLGVQAKHNFPQKLAQLVSKEKYGEIVEAPPILRY